MPSIATIFKATSKKIHIAKQTLLGEKKKNTQFTFTAWPKQLERLLQIYKSNLPELWINRVFDSPTKLFNLIN